MERAREHPCSRDDALTHKAAIRVHLAGVLEVDDHGQLPIKPEETNAIGPVFDLVWQRQPAVFHQRHEPALHKLLLIDWCHGDSMRPTRVTEPDTFVPALQQVAFEALLPGPASALTRAQSEPRCAATKNPRKPRKSASICYH